jgi:hypothetical protein
MAQTNREIFQDRQAGTTASDIGGIDTVHAMHDFGFVHSITNTAANGAVALTKVWSNMLPYPVVVTCRLNCDAAVAFNATNYANHIISVDDGANTAPVVAATFSSNTVNYAADIDASPASSSTTNSVIVSGGNLFVEVTQTAAGVALPVRLLKFKFRRK